MVLPQLRHMFPVPHARSFVTVVISTLALILACLLFAPSSVTWGALSGSLPFAAIIAIVGLGQLLVVQQGGFDLSLAGGVSLAVVISTHYPQGDNALLLPAVLIAIACAIMAGLANGILVSLFRLNAIVATIGVNALLYGAVFAVSGGVPKTTTTLLAAIAGGQRTRASKLRLFRAGRVAGGFIRLEKVCGRKALRSDRRKSIGYPRRGTSRAASSTLGLCLCPAPLLHGRPARGRHHPRTHSIPRRFPALAFRRCCRSRWNVAAWRSWFSDLDRHRRVLPEPVEPIRTRSWRAVFGSDHHPGFGLGFWYRRLLCPVDGKHDQANQTNVNGGKNEVLGLNRNWRSPRRRQSSPSGAPIWLRPKRRHGAARRKRRLLCSTAMAATAGAR